MAPDPNHDPLRRNRKTLVTAAVTAPLLDRQPDRNNIIWPAHAEIGLRLGEPRGPIKFGVRDVGVVVAPQQPRPSSRATTATRDLHLGNVADAQSTLRAIEDFAASVVRRHDGSIPGSAEIDPSAQCEPAPWWWASSPARTRTCLRLPRPCGSPARSGLPIESLVRILELEGDAVECRLDLCIETRVGRLQPLEEGTPLLLRIAVMR